MTLFDAYPYSYYPIPVLTAFLVIIIFLVIEGCLVTISLGIKASEKQDKKPLTLLIINFLMLSAGMALIAVPTFSALLRGTIGDSNYLIYGIPIGGGYQVYWSDIAYSLMILSSCCILLFDKELFVHRDLFKKHQRILFPIYYIGIVIFIIWALYIGIFEFSNPSDPNYLESLSTGPGILFIVLSVFPWIVLFIYARKDLTSIRTEKTLYVVGFKLIESSGIIMTISDIAYLVEGFFTDPNVYSIFDVVIIAFYIGAMFLLYIGFRLPDWFKN